MHPNSKWLLRTAVLLTAFILIAGTAVTAAFALSGGSNAGATGEWLTVAQTIDSYLSSQYDSGDGGERGYLEKAATLKQYLDNNNSGTGDNVFLGEGDDAANAPVLVDVLPSQASLIPGTSIRVPNTTAADTTSAPAVKAIVDRHRAAGFSTEVITYCATGHAQSPVTMAYGAMSASGYFGSPNPVVKGLKWGRQGWNYNLAVAPNYPYQVIGNRPSTAKLATPGAYTLASNLNCTGTVPTSELIRCTAQAAIAGAGTGQVPWTSGLDGSFQPVDIRSIVAVGPSDVRSYLGSGTTDGGPGYSMAIPIDELFKGGAGGTYDNLKKIDYNKTVVFYNSTAHTALMAAEGAQMLGYPARGLRWGMPYWNGLSGAGNVPNWPEKLNTSSPDYRTYPCVGASPCSGSLVTAIDTKVPVVTAGPSASSITTSSADISRETSAPATSKIHLVGSDGHVVDLNDTVLNAVKTTTVSGLHPGINYTGVLTAYSGQAWGSSEAIISFTTADISTDRTPPVTTDNAPAGWQTAAVNVTLTCTDNSPGGSGCAATNYIVDAGSIQTGTSVSLANDGTHTIEYWSTDFAGNVETPSNKATVMIDGTVPVVTPPPGQTVEAAGPTGAIVTYPAASATDAHSGVATGPSCVPASGSLFALGATVVQCTATDNAGNTGTASMNVRVNDTIKPVTTDDAPAGWQTADVTVTLSCTDTGSGCGNTHYMVDGGAIQAGNSVSITTDGTHNIEYWSDDNVLNAEIPHKTATVQLDKTGPVMTYIGPTGGIPSGIVHITATGTATDAASGLAGVTAEIDPGSPFNWWGPSSCIVDGMGNVTCNAIGIYVGDGPHTVVLTARDNVGNTSTAAGSITIDGTAPATTDNAPAGWQTADVIVTLSCTDTGSGCASTNYKVDGGATQAGNSVSITTDGTHSIEYWSTDGAGNEEWPHKTATVQLDKTGPVVTYIGPTGAIPGGIVHITATGTASDAASGLAGVTAEIDPGSPFNWWGHSSCIVDGMGNVTCNGIGTYVGDGPHTVVLTARDNVGNTSTATGSITIDGTQPVLSLPADITVHTTNPAGAAVSFTATATDAIDGSVPVVSTPPSGSMFPVGTTVVGNTATDVAGNTASGSFNVNVVMDCVGAKPNLGIASHNAFWASYADYIARQLTVHLIVANSGATVHAYSVAITGATANNGVIFTTPVPVALGDIAAGSSVATDITYQVPPGVIGFLTAVNGVANDVCGFGYTYP